MNNQNLKDAFHSKVLPKLNVISNVNNLLKKHLLIPLYNFIFIIKSIWQQILVVLYAEEFNSQLLNLYLA